ncbi:MAG: hypothetical protein JRJ66_01415 [Deltaproteobacteria bacterium]|nr:hypothetical protein [Deltaproteobacteria bacterium]MBW2081696.1 hypothetical protein [Deltaproteobacteria bacterium]MBW2298891.1 hypothetical protein [Deltaproteobacteria bacterium]
MGNSILYNTAGSIALAVNYEIQGPYNDKFLTKEADTTVRINADFYVRVGDTVFCIEDDTDLTESDLDVGSSFDASSTYYVYACQPLDGSDTPVFKISKNSTYPSGWNANNSRKIGGFDTDASGNVDDTTLWDLRTVDVTCTGVEDSQIPANEISLSKLKYQDLGKVLVGQGDSDAIAAEHLPRVNLLTNTGFQVWSNSGLDQGSGVGRQTDYEVGSAIADDDCADDDTTDWTTGSNTSLAFDTDHYEMTNDAANEGAYIPNRSLTKGHLYKVSIDIKDGTASGATVKLFIQDGSYAAASFTTTATWQTISSIIEAPLTSANGNVGIKVPASLGGNNIEFRNFHVHEVTPGCVESNYFGPDGWKKDLSINLLRESSQTKEGEYYSLKMVNRTGAAGALYYPFGNLRNEVTFVEKWKGRTITVGAWLYTTDANTFKLGVQDDVNGFQLSDYISTGSWTWVEHTINISSSISWIHPFVVYCEASSGAIIYISQPILVFGSSIGEGNYVPPQDKVINLESQISLQDYNNSTVSSDTAINMESQSSGKLGKGIKAYWINVAAKCSSAGYEFHLRAGSGGPYGLSLRPQVANVFFEGVGRVGADSDSDIYLQRNNTYTNVYIQVLAAEVR